MVPARSPSTTTCVQCAIDVTTMRRRTRPLCGSSILIGILCHIAPGSVCSSRNCESQLPDTLDYPQASVLIACLVVNTNKLMLTLSLDYRQQASIASCRPRLLSFAVHDDPYHNVGETTESDFSRWRLSLTRDTVFFFFFIGSTDETVSTACLVSRRRFRRKTDPAVESVPRQGDSRPLSFRTTFRTTLCRRTASCLSANSRDVHTRVTFRNTSDST